MRRDEKLCKSFPCVKQLLVEVDKYGGEALCNENKARLEDKNRLARHALQKNLIIIYLTKSRQVFFVTKKNK